ncbi:MurR/RpiR family transcriptional regulator [Lapidilactobacillus salsurivasis]
MSVKGNIQGMQGKLSATERQIADYVLAHPDEVLKMTVQDLAATSGASAATVSRFARKLNFSGYSELKIQLSSDLSTTNFQPELYKEIQRNESLHSIKSKLLNNAEQSLRETVDQIRPEVVDQLIKQISRSYQLLLFGVGASYLAAEDIAQKWTRLGYACTCSDDLNQILPLAVTADRKKSLVWLVSNSGESPEVIMAARIAKRAQLPVITMTKIGNNTLSKLADISIQTSQPMESNLRIAATQSLHAQFMLIDILYYAFVSRFYDEAKENVERSYDAITEYKQTMRRGLH